MSDNLVSVVMPCFNAARFLGAAVASVLAQTHSAVELIVVDDGSTDESPRILESLSSAESSNVVVLKQSNLGPYPARNLGLKHAQGRFVAFLDADDYWHSSFLEKLIGAMKKSHAPLAYCGWQNVGIDGPGGEPYVPPDYANQDIYAAFLKHCPWPIHAALLERELAEKVGGFSERYFTSLDYDFWLRILAETQHMVRVPETLAYYRWHGSGQISSDRPRQVMDAWRVRRDFVNRHASKVGHLDVRCVRQLVNQSLRNAALDAFWRRDIADAQTMLRSALVNRALSVSDLKYGFAAWLPFGLFQKVTKRLGAAARADADSE